ncbi:TIGR03752 family integrating conjugative element protein [Erwinia tracheiphila]|uniref:TIGR03752 family integrating conjugative element protein n=1 Tax=Erwinia tracheiphila TaxID=65700 RepID=A0A345CU05_9GAMM|nr:TIGR03752 family integrating conjugative element protein [Erwinia tracheiphila]AXF76922.1 TIGR03752 family integrating conjugative element protein [Erwinia tracheiphila]UIA84401.1 TIGR03752 family integrating conjugative element protein [Erwinia tracheiphila]UIA92981.1 TIGR03752 family integrating conjugative element protein [Erwinia tracheiphila]
MQIKSNALVKFIVPAVVIAGLAVGLKSCKNAPEHPKTAATGDPLQSLSPDELKALGVEGDTPEDTLRTLIGRLNDVRDRQKTLDQQNAELVKENARLRKRSQDVSGQVNEAVNGLRSQYDKKQRQLQDEQSGLTAKIQQLTDSLKKPENKKAAEGDIPMGLGLDGMGSSTGSAATPGGDGLMWVSPTDQKETSPQDAASGKAGPQFPTSFLSENALTRQKAGYEETVKGHTSEKGAQEQAEPVYTLPENSTLVGSRAMTALLGRVPINGTVTDPYPFKVLIGKDNLTANGIELPDVEGAVVSGTASGDWTLSCVRGQVNSVTFVFADGTVRTLPKPDVGTQQNNAQNKQETGTSGGIGWISDENGIPCIGGERKSNASTYLPTLFGLSAAGAAGEALSQGQYTTQNNVNGISSTLTGSAGQAAMGKALSGGLSETTDWVKQRYGMTFDAIYVPPGAHLAVHITRQLAIDYEDKGRKVRYGFALPGGISDSGGLD